MFFLIIRGSNLRYTIKHNFHLSSPNSHLSPHPLKIQNNLKLQHK